MAYIIRTNGTIEQSNDKLTLEYMQKIVNGYIQIINVRGCCMIMDEEGKLNKKPINKQATALARLYNAIFPNDVIVGDVIVADRNEVE